MVAAFQGARPKYSERVPPGEGLRAQDCQPETEQGKQQQRRRGHGLGIFIGAGVPQSCGERLEPIVNQWKGTELLENLFFIFIDYSHLTD